MSDVTRLGPMWVAELKSDIAKRRNDTAAMASRCKPDGDYRKQMEMVLAELDLMLAAPDLLAALQEALKLIQAECADGAYTEQSAMACAAIAKATGSAK